MKMPREERLEYCQQVVFIKILFSIFLKITFDFLYACVECTCFLRLSNRQIKTRQGGAPNGGGVRVKEVGCERMGHTGKGGVG
jgi:hypothetical protein